MPPEIPPPPGPRGPKGLPGATWRWWHGIVLFVVGDLLIAQFLVATAVLLALGVTEIREPYGPEEYAAQIDANAAFAGVIVAWLAAYHRGWFRALGVWVRGKIAKDVAVGLGLGAVLYVAVILVSLALAVAFGLITGEQVSPPDQIPKETSEQAKVVVAILAILVAPPVEELFYRGILFRSVRDRRGFWAGAVFSSVLFGLVHYVPAPWLNAALLQSTMMFTGLGLAAIYELRGTLVTSIAAHLAFNVIGMSIILLAG